MYSLVQTFFSSQTGPHTGTIPVLFRTDKISLLVLVFEHKAINTKKRWKPVQRHFKPPATAILRVLLETGPGRNWATRLQYWYVYHVTWWRSGSGSFAGVSQHKQLCISILSVQMLDKSHTIKLFLFTQFALYYHALVHLCNRKKK